MFTDAKTLKYLKWHFLSDFDYSEVQCFEHWLKKKQTNSSHSVKCLCDYHKSPPGLFLSKFED